MLEHAPRACMRTCIQLTRACALHVYLAARLLDDIIQTTRDAGGECNVEMAAAMIERGDTNKDGYIDFPEYMRIIAADPGLWRPPAAAVVQSGVAN